MVARYLERRLEQLVEGLAGLVFRGSVQPAELASRLVREADLAIEDGPAGPVVPNHYTVALAAEMDETSRVEAELASFLEDAAAARGWRLDGPVIVRLVPTPDHHGRPDVTTARVAADRPAWAHLDLRDEALAVTNNRVIIGRSENSDVVVGAPEVSRSHALLFREAGQIWIEDLGSANGTSVNGAPAQRAEIHDGSTVSFGTVMATLRLR